MTKMLEGNYAQQDSIDLLTDSSDLLKDFTDVLEVSLDFLKGFSDFLKDSIDSLLIPLISLTKDSLGSLRILLIFCRMSLIFWRIFHDFISPRYYYLYIHNMYIHIERGMSDAEILNLAVGVGAGKLGCVLSKNLARLACVEPCARFRPAADIRHHKEQIAHTMDSPRHVPCTATAMNGIATDSHSQREPPPRTATANFCRLGVGALLLEFGAPSRSGKKRYEAI